jgi:hypothetical protein
LYRFYSESVPYRELEEGEVMKIERKSQNASRNLDDENKFMFLDTFPTPRMIGYWPTDVICNRYGYLIFVRFNPAF